MSGYLTDDANPLTYSITWDAKTKQNKKQNKNNNNNNNKNNNNKRTNKETSKIKQQIRHDGTLEVNNTHFNDKWKIKININE